VFSSGLIVSDPAAGIEIRETDAVTKDFTLTVTQSQIKFLGFATGLSMRFVTKPSNLSGAEYEAIQIDATTGEVIVGHTTPTAARGVATKSYVEAGLTAAQAYADASLSTLESKVNTNAANASATWSNVYAIQGALGYVKDQVTDYNKIITVTTPSFASNITVLWTQFKDVRANILTGYDPGTGAVTSLWSNVQTLTSRVKTVEDGALRADGSVTLKATLTPDTTSQRDLGTNALRYRNFFGNVVNAGNLVAVGTLNSTADFPTTDNARRTAGTLPIAMFGNITLAGNINFNQASAVSGGQAGITSNVTIYGAVTTVNDMIPLVDNARQIGSATKRYKDIYAVTFRGTATSAQYADVAERYHADYAYPVGTLVQIGGPYEITQENDDLSEHVLGVISSNPAYLMNSEAGEHQTHPPVAMVGRTPVRVIGRCIKGDRLVSAGRGVARRARPGEATHFNVVGRALADKYDDDENLVEAVILLTL
jgi:hypothetical protein